MQRDALPISERLQETLDRLGDEFLVAFFEAETARHPGNIDALAELGQIHTRLGHYDRGLAVDRQLVRLVPENPTAHYNLACSLARLESREEAMDALERAVELGFGDAEFMRADEDLSNLRGEERFRSLLRLLGERATA